MSLYGLRYYAVCYSDESGLAGFAPVLLFFKTYQKMLNLTGYTLAELTQVENLNRVSIANRRDDKKLIKIAFYTGLWKNTKKQYRYLDEETSEKILSLFRMIADKNAINDINCDNAENSVTALKYRTEKNYKSSKNSMKNLQNQK